MYVVVFDWMYIVNNDLLLDQWDFLEHELQFDEDVFEQQDHLNQVHTKHLLL